MVDVSGLSNRERLLLLGESCEPRSLFSTASVIRLVGAVMAEQDDEWAVGRRYMSLESLVQGHIHVIEGDHQPQEVAALVPSS